MQKEILFIKTLEDIEKKMASQDAYEIFMIAGLLRKLLVDDFPLVNQINRVKKLKITFLINARKINDILKSATFYSMEDGFDPNTSHMAETKEVNMDEMLSAHIMFINGEAISVRDLIKFISNVQGSIHAGQPKNSKENMLVEVQKYFSIGGLPAGIRTLLSVSRVVLRGLDPLRMIIKNDFS
jgi:hypothetical protein